MKQAMVTTSATSSRRSPALRSRSIGVGLLAVRSRAAAKRALDDESLTDRDVDELTKVRNLIDEAADALRYGTVAGTEPTAPTARQITSVGLALTTAAGPTDELDRQAVATRLSSLVADLDSLLAGRPPQNLNQLPAFLDGLVSAADRDTAQSGETLVRRG